MSKAVEELSKNLATGVSRRRALWRFATGIGAVAGLGFLTRGKAKAQPSPFFCFQEMEAEYECCISYDGPANDCFAAAAAVYQECMSGAGLGGVKKCVVYYK